MFMDDLLEIYTQINNKKLRELKVVHREQKTKAH